MIVTTCSMPVVTPRHVARNDKEEKGRRMGPFDNGLQGCDGKSQG